MVVPAPMLRVNLAPLVTVAAPVMAMRSAVVLPRPKFNCLFAPAVRPLSVRPGVVLPAACPYCPLKLTAALLTKAVLAGSAPTLPEIRLPALTVVAPA